MAVSAGPPGCGVYSHVVPLRPCLCSAHVTPEPTSPLSPRLPSAHVSLSAHASHLLPISFLSSSRLPLADLPPQPTFPLLLPALRWPCGLLSLLGSVAVLVTGVQIKFKATIIPFAAVGVDDSYNVSHTMHSVLVAPSGGSVAHPRVPTTTHFPFSHAEKKTQEKDARCQSRHSLILRRGDNNECSLPILSGRGEVPSMRRSMYRLMSAR